MKRLIIASTSTLHGGAYLEYLMPEIETLFKKAKQILFVPFARPGGISHDEYTGRVKEAFSKIGKEVRGIHEFDDPEEAIREAEGIFTGGGNTFLLVRQLYDLGLIEILAETVSAGTPYLGSSAGSNICGLTMQTTNDMPIVLPSDFRTMGSIPMNLNPHYLDADLQSKHMGETRETRIREFHQFNSIPVLGLREGSFLEVTGEAIILRGPFSARLFRKNSDPIEIVPETDLSFLK